MRKIIANPKRWENPTEPLFLFLMHDMDTYLEWYNLMKDTITFGIVDYKNDRENLSDNSCYLIKQELEYIFQTREKITWENLDPYFNTWNRAAWINWVISYLLAVYYDFYKKDDEFDRKLYESTKEYFWINQEDIDRYRKI